MIMPSPRPTQARVRVCEGTPGTSPTCAQAASTQMWSPGGSFHTSREGELGPHHTFGDQGPKRRFASGFEQFQNKWLWGVTVPHFWTEQPPALGEAKPGQGQAIGIQALSALLHSRPGRGRGVQRDEGEGAAPCVWMLGRNLQAASRRWEMPHPWTTGHIRTDLSSSSLPCAPWTGSALSLQDHPYIARLGTQQEVGLKTSK